MCKSDTLERYSLSGSLEQLYKKVRSENIDITVLDFCRVTPKYMKRLTPRQFKIFSLYYLQRTSIIDILRYYPEYQFWSLIERTVNGATN